MNFTFHNDSFSLYECIGLLIKKLRVSRGISGLELGEIMGVSQQQISRYERGKTEITLSQLQNISSAFNMTLWEFVEILHFIYQHKNNEYKAPENVDYDKTLWWGIDS